MIQHLFSKVLPVSVAMFVAFASTTDATTEAVYQSGEGYHTYRIPAIVQSKKGTLLAFAEGREDRKDHGDVDIVLRRSEDQGKSWQNLQVIRDVGKHQAGNPCPLVDEETGRLHLFYCGSEVSEGAVLAGKGTREVYSLYSDDDGLTWSEPRNLSKMVKKEGWRWYATGPCSAIQIQSGKYAGRFVIPANHSIHFEGTDRKWEYRCHSLYSDDKGETWQIGSSSEVGASETQIAEVAPDLLIQDIRMQTHRKGVRAVRFSKDGGETWSPLEHDDSRLDPKCQGSIIALRADGAKPFELISTSLSSKGPRVNLTAYRSKDGGQDWSEIITLTKGPSAYSDLVSMEQGKIGCLYEAGEKDPYETILFTVFE
ncbi:sialidase family protein [Roseibacillus persicicus]|uniref:sialidase family protein n=1 Tax=Roseibacillus persicicus TaxID=454148 RepID=UPI0016764AFD|nr:sialidase family protein [Roseibacillus persicicus]